jgi:hypothetical protein
MTKTVRVHKTSGPEVMQFEDIEVPSEIAACNTKRTPHKLKRQMSRVLH